MKSRLYWLLLPLLMFALAGCNEEAADDSSEDNTEQNDSSNNTSNNNTNDNDSTDDDSTNDDATAAGALPGDINFTPLGGFNGIYVRVSGAGVTDTNYVLRDARGGNSISNGANNNSHRSIRFSLANTSNSKVLNYYTEATADQLPGAFTGTTRVNSVIVQVPWTFGPGTFQCSDNTIFQINNVNAESCTIEVSHITRSGGVAGRVVTASFASPVAYTVTDTPFKVYQHKGTAGEPTDLARRGFASLYIDADQNTFEFPGNQHFILNNNPVGGASSVGVSPIDGTDYFDGNADDTIRMNFVTGISAGVASSTCSGSTRRIELHVGRYQHKMMYTTNRTGGSCTFTRQQIHGGFYVTAYEATLIAPSNEGVPNDQTELKISGQYATYMLSNEDLGAGNSGNEGALGDKTLAIEMLVVDGNNLFTEDHKYVFDHEDNDQTVARSESEGFFSIYSSRKYRQAQNLILEIENIPTTPATYSCNTTYTGAGGSSTEKRPHASLSASQGFEYATSTGFGDSITAITGASCSVVVTGVTDSSITGTYTATVAVTNDDFRNYLADDGTVSISGAFRLAR
ncbi:hypothetical protein ACFOSD_01865 [Salinispirillum marinum]|uniref:Uncharacterized protein n=2 Tax=Saccharospirillaceae TaxID=255527 RepID=A0ABV8B9T1_9GAMM